MNKVPVIMLGAWAVFASSWLLPTFFYLGSTIRGWEAFLAALHPEMRLHNVVANVSALTNGLMLLSIAIFLRPRSSQRAPGWLAWGFVVATAIDLSWAYWRDGYSIGALLVGYWLWVASFGLGAVALFRMRSRQASAASV